MPFLGKLALNPLPSIRHATIRESLREILLILFIQCLLDSLDISHPLA